MKKTGLIVLLILAFTGNANAQKHAQKVRKPRVAADAPLGKDSVVKIKPSIVKADTALPVKKHVRAWDPSYCFPLSPDKLYNVYDFVIYLDDERVEARYRSYFDKYRYKYSGYVWEALIREMLADADKELSNDIVMRSETNAVMINITKHQSIKKFPEYMCNIFSNMGKFDDYLKKANRTQIPNY